MTALKTFPLVESFSEAKGADKTGAAVSPVLVLANQKPINIAPMIETMMTENRNFLNRNKTAKLLSSDGKKARAAPLFESLS